MEHQRQAAATAAAAATCHVNLGQMPTGLDGFGDLGAMGTAAPPHAAATATAAPQVAPTDGRKKQKRTAAAAAASASGGVKWAPYTDAETEALIEEVGPYRKKNQSTALSWDKVAAVMHELAAAKGWPQRAQESYKSKWENALKAYKAVAQWNKKNSGAAVAFHQCSCA